MTTECNKLHNISQLTSENNCYILTRLDWDAKSLKALKVTIQNRTHPPTQPLQHLTIDKVNKQGYRTEGKKAKINLFELTDYSISLIDTLPDQLYSSDRSYEDLCNRNVDNKSLFQMFIWRIFVSLTIDILCQFLFLSTKDCGLENCSNIFKQNLHSVAVLIFSYLLLHLTRIVGCFYDAELQVRMEPASRHYIVTTSPPPAYKLI